jgi:hypothetical protein
MYGIWLHIHNSWSYNQSGLCVGWLLPSHRFCNVCTYYAPSLSNTLSVINKWRTLTDRQFIRNVTLVEINPGKTKIPEGNRVITKRATEHCYRNKYKMTQTIIKHPPVAYREGGWGVQPPPPRNSEVLTNLSRIPCSVENTSVTV